MLNIGTVSHGTLRPQDLLKSFSEAYKQYCEGMEGFDASLYDQAQDWAYHVEHDSEDFQPRDYEIVDETLDELIEKLEELAARYGCYFGATEGDGSDFGFWPNEGGEA